jgi:hypothetical protein
LPPPFPEVIDPSERPGKKRKETDKRKAPGGAFHLFAKLASYF